MMTAAAALLLLCCCGPEDPAVLQGLGLTRIGPQPPLVGGVLLCCVALLVLFADIYLSAVAKAAAVRIGTLSTRYLR